MAHTKTVLSRAILNLAPSRKAKGARREALLASTMLAMAGVLISPAFAQVALPTNGQVTSGQATISSPSDASLTISQSSDKAIIDWSSFSIGKDGTVRFDNGNGATLNRVTGASLSSIDGLLSATGSVYLINPNGVIVGKGGVVNVGGNFVGSTLNVSNADFLKGGNLTFDGLSGASVINFGKVGSLGGDVALIANTVSNAGDITAPKGTVGLIAGQSVLMRDASVDGGKFLILRGGNGASVSHSGLISATAAELAAEGGSIYALAGNTQDIERATDVVESEGKLYLATGPKSGGDITVTADAVIDASSTQGQGGSIKVIADMTSGKLLFQGRALAKGGFGSKGGFVETSGAYVNFDGARVDTSAQGGLTGLWLTDPYDLVVNASAASTIQTNLATTNVTLQTTNVGTSGPGTPNASGTGDITINSAISWSSGNVLTLDAYHGININAALTVSGTGGVSLITNNGGTGGDYSFGLGASGFAGKIAFTGAPNSGQSLSINGNAYTLLYSMGDVATLTGGTGRYALANSLTSGTTYTDSVAGLFSGTFTGLGNTISGLTINGTNYVNTALIAESTGTVRDIGLLGGTVTGAYGTNNVGSLIGYNNAGTIQNAYSSTTIANIGEAQSVGGLIGFSSGAVKNSYATGAVNGSYAVGGLIGGTQGGTIDNSYATGNVSNTYMVSAGGLVGRLHATTVTNTHATGNVSNGGGSFAGGLVGMANENANISNSYATGAVSGVEHIGGLIGYLEATVSNSYATGAITGAFNAGGLVGYANIATVSTSYATGTVTNNEIGGSTSGGLIGRAATSTISDVYATGAVTGVGNNIAFGGLIGYIDTTTSVSRGYATGLLTVGANSVAFSGAIGANNTGTTISNVYYDYQTTGQGAGVQVNGTTGLTTAALQGTLPTGFASPTWGTAAGYYPFFGGALAPTQKVSGFAYNSNGSAASGATVGVYTGGNLLNGGTVTSGANGYYYYTVPVGTAVASTQLGAALTLSGDTTASGLSYTDAPIISGVDVVDLDITSGIYAIKTTQTSYSTLLANVTATFGSGNYTSLLTGLGSSTERRIFAATSFNIDQSISTTGKLLIQANDGDMTIGSGAVVQSSASGDAIVLAANGGFTNNGGASSVVASSGRWLIYSQAHNAPTAVPTFAVTGGLSGKSYYNDAFNFTTSSFASAANSGNRFVYGYAPTLTVSPTTTSVVYNGLAQTDTYAGSGYLNAGDQADDSFTGTITGLTASSKNVGAYALTASGTLASDLNYGISYGSGTLTITPAALTASLTGNTTKTYDATTTATLIGSNYALTGLIGSDAVTVSGTSAAYGDKNAGSAKSVTASGLALTGTDAGNYTVNTTASGNIGTINQAALTLSAVTDTKTYNATTASSGTVGVSGLQGSDTVTGATQTFDSKNAGSRTLNVTGYTVNDGNSGGNYVLTLNTAAGTINQAALTLSAVTDTKTYNGDTASSGTVGVSGLQGTDTVTGATQTYDSRNAGSRTLSVGGYTVNDGNSGANYALTLNTATGTINQASLTIAAATDTKVYDGTTASTAAPSTSGLVTGDTVTGLSQSFDSKNAGARTITVNGTYTINDGNGGNNYVVTTGALTTAGTITPASLTASLTGNTTKTYDATTVASLTSGNYGLSGVIGSDAVSVSGTSASYGDKNAGTAKSVTASGLALTGTDAGNYTVNSSASANIGTINQAALTLSAVTDTKTYNGTTASSGTVGVSGLQGTDTATGLVQTFDSKNAGTRTLNVTGYTVNDGNSGGNYVLTLNTAAGTINQAALTAALTGTTTKTYDGTTTATLIGANYGLTGLISGDAVSVSGTSATYLDKNAGSGKSVTASGLTLAGTDAANYTVNSSASANIGTINQAALTASLTGNTTKTYDGNTSANLTSGNYGLSGVVSGDAVTVSGTSAAYGDKNAGSAKSVTASGLALTGTDAGNYTVNTTASGNIGTINQAALTLSAVTDTKTYNATTASSGTVGVSGLQGSDTVTGATQTFDSKNAGSRTLNVTGYTVNDGNSGGNYVLTLNTAAGTINQAALTLSAVTDTKTYNGDTASSGTVGVSGLQGTDTVTGATQTYDSRNAGSRTLSVGGYTVNDGNSGANYALTLNTATGTINQASLTIAAATDTKVYDGTTASTAAPSTSGLVTGDTVTGLSQSFDSKNAGARTITVNGTYTINDGNGGNNYAVTTGALTTAGTITPASLTASLTGNTTKTYDATTAATLIGSNYALTGLIGSDAVTVSGTSAAYGDKNAGSGKSVTATGLALTGTDAGNYTVNSSASGNIGTINQAALTLSAVTDTKTYNGTTASSGTVGVSGLQGTDTATGLVQTFDSKNAGTRTLNVTGYTVNDGNSGGNYVLTLNTAAGTINQAALTAALTGTTTKTYDGTTTATLIGANYGLTGLISGDTVSVSGTSATYIDKNAGSGKSVTASGLTLSGTDAANYTVNSSASANIGTINQASLTASLTGNTTKTYDGTTSATLIGSNYALTGLIGSDAVTVSGTSAAYGDKNAGSTKSVTASGLALTGTDASNYTVNSSASANIGTINKASLTLAAATDTKTYNATTASSGAATVSGLVAGDTVTGVTQTFDSKNAGSRTLNVTGYTITDGNSGGNYTVVLQSAAGTINQAALTAALTGTTTKAYDGTTAATLIGSNYAMTGLIGTDSVSVTGTGTYADKNAGTAKSVTASGLILGGTDGGNYTVNATASANIGTITKASLTVTADPKNKIQGVPDPALTYSLTSGTLFSGDALTGSLTRTVGEDAGSYDITQGTLAASSNYNLTYIKGTFTITPIMLLTTLRLTPVTPAEDLQVPGAGEGEVTFDGDTCTSSDKCPSHPYPTNQVISSTIRFASK